MASFVLPASTNSINTLEIIVREKRGLQAFHIQTPTQATSSPAEANVVVPLPSTPTMNPAFLYYHCSTHNNISSGPSGSSSGASLASKLSLDVRQPPIYSPDGSMLCLVYESGTSVVEGPLLSVLVVKTTNGESCFTLNRNDISGSPVFDVQKATFSPKGTFLVTWSRPLTTKGIAEGTSFPNNLHIWHLQSGRLASSFTQKTFKADTIQWIADESYCFRLVTNEIHVLTCKFDVVTEASRSDENFLLENKVYHKGVAHFRVAPKATNSSVGIAIFEPEHGGKPGRVSLYEYSLPKKEVSGPLCSRTIFGASEAALLWSSLGMSLLIHSHSDVDNSNSSYYGATGLYIMRRGSEESSIVEQSKEGPIHDVKWSPSGDKFVVNAGTMPCHSTLFNEKGEAVFQFGAAHRNTISWAPHGRYLVLAGFGNLAGEMDFYDILRLRKLGSNVSHCATVYEWSPDSRYFMTATLAPRMNVDNGFKIFKYSGAGPILQRNLERAFDCAWRPALPGVYPGHSPSPKRGGSSGSDSEVPLKAPATAVPLSASVPYRPPKSTGEIASFMERDSKGPVGKITGVSTTTPTTSNSTGSKYQAPGKQRVIPGLAPVTKQVEKKQAKNSSGNGGGSASAKKESTTEASVKRTTPDVAPLPSSTPVAPVTIEAEKEKEMSAEEKEKRIKAIRKKLKQVEEIKVKVNMNIVIDADQRKKLDSEAALINELKELH